MEPSPGRLRTAKRAKGNTPAANLEDFIPEEGDLKEQQSVKASDSNEVLVVNPSAESDAPAPATPVTRSKRLVTATPVQQKEVIQQEAEVAAEESYDEEESTDEEKAASTVITVKRALKSERQKQADRMRKVQMGRPWNWGKKTTLMYERKEKSFAKKEEEDTQPKQTETLIIKNTARHGHTPAKKHRSIGRRMSRKSTKLIQATTKNVDHDPEMPPIVLASEDGAIISADALELSDTMGGTVQVQVVNQQDDEKEDNAEVVEIRPMKHSEGMLTPQQPKKAKLPPTSAPPKVSLMKFRPIEDVPCQICDAKVSNHESLLRHIKKIHMDVDGVEDYLEEVQMEMQVECPVCNVALESQSALYIHMDQQHSQVGDVRCDPCNKSYKNVASLKNHIRQQHTTRRRYECHVCSATFTETRSLREHVNCVHETTETFDCGICGKTFLTKGRLRRHKYIHQGYRHYCEYCNKGFHLKDNMNKHVEIMHEQKFGKRFQCNYCGKAFTVKGNLQQHILGVHLRKSLYECPICNEGFKRKLVMLDHMKSHARPKQEPGASMVEVVNPAKGINEGDTSGEEDYDYVEFD